jgi:hypothetical protein
MSSRRCSLLRPFMVYGAQISSRTSFLLCVINLYFFNQCLQDEYTKIDSNSCSLRVFDVQANITLDLLVGCVWSLLALNIVPHGLLPSLSVPFVTNLGRAMPYRHLRSGKISLFLVFGFHPLTQPGPNRYDEQYPESTPSLKLRVVSGSITLDQVMQLEQAASREACRLVGRPMVRTELLFPLMLTTYKCECRCMTWWNG